MLTCHNLCSIRGEKLLFSHLGFTLREGDFLLLTGHNGSGKTTLMRMLSGLMKPESGEILWQKTSISGNADYLRHMVYIGHHNALKPELSVYDNIHFWAALKGCEMLVPAAMQFFGLWAMRDVLAGQLSAGWQRRVALARLLAIPSLVWLLDEPASNLDATGNALLKGLIETRLKQGGIVVMTGHSPMPELSAAYLQMEDFAGVLPEGMAYDD